MSHSDRTPEQKRRELAAAKRWMTRRKRASGPEKLRCHDEALGHLYRMLGSMPRHPGPGKLL